MRDIQSVVHIPIERFRASKLRETSQQTVSRELLFEQIPKKHVPISRTPTETSGFGSSNHVGGCLFEVNKMEENVQSLAKKPDVQMSDLLLKAG